jgi:hypothetical protein
MPFFSNSYTGRAVSAASRTRDSVDFGSRSLGSPNPFLAPAGVAAHEDRQDQIDRRCRCIFEVRFERYNYFSTIFRGGNVGS